MACLGVRTRVLAMLLLGLAACGDDTVSGQTMSGTGSGTAGSDTSGGPPPPGTSSSGEIPDGTADDTGTTGGTDTGDSSSGTDTGEPVASGHTGGTWVNAGSFQLQSPGFRLHFTFGQSTTNQTTMTSAGYRLRGGLVPAVE